MEPIRKNIVDIGVQWICFKASFQTYKYLLKSAENDSFASNIVPNSFLLANDIILLRIAKTHVRSRRAIKTALQSLSTKFICLKEAFFHVC